MGLKRGVLAVQAGVLVVAGGSGESDGQRICDGGLMAKRVRRGIVLGATARLSRRQQLAGDLPITKLAKCSASNPGRFACLH